MKRKSELEQTLRKLTSRVESSWAELHPVTDKKLQAVREEVRKQWDQQQKARKGLEEIHKGKKTASEDVTKSLSTTQVAHPPHGLMLGETGAAADQQPKAEMEKVSVKPSRTPIKKKRVISKSQSKKPGSKVIH